MIHEIIRVHFGCRYKTDNNPWSFKRKSRSDLVILWNKLGFKIGVEIGTQYGDFAMAIAKLIPEVNLTCIDPWIVYKEQRRGGRAKLIYETALKNLSSYPNVKIMRMTSMEALKSFEDRSLDFAFIDGAHDFDNVCPDIIFWSKKVKLGGMIACHDCHPSHWTGVWEAVDGYTRTHHIDPWYIIAEREPTAFWVNNHER